MTEISLKRLPKVSSNDTYAGMHWTKRTKLKNQYKAIVRLQWRSIFKVKRYKVSYKFIFKKNPLDASNCSVMLKMIEDILFEKDNWNLIDIGEILSRKGEEDEVIIKVEEIDVKI